MLRKLNRVEGSSPCRSLTPFLGCADSRVYYFESAHPVKMRKTCDEESRVYFHGSSAIRLVSWREKPKKEKFSIFPYQTPSHLRSSLDCSRNCSVDNIRKCYIYIKKHVIFLFLLLVSWWWGKPFWKVTCLDFRPREKKISSVELFWLCDKITMGEGEKAMATKSSAFIRDPP